MTSNSTDSTHLSERPKERIEKLLSSSPDDKNHRIHKRLGVESGSEVLFSIVCKGEVVDISDEGMSIRFTPTESPSLENTSQVDVTLELENHRFSIPGIVRRVESRFGVIVMGLQFDSTEIAVEEK